MLPGGTRTHVAIHFIAILYHCTTRLGVPSISHFIDDIEIYIYELCASFRRHTDLALTLLPQRRSVSAGQQSPFPPTKLHSQQGQHYTHRPYAISGLQSGALGCAVCSVARCGAPSQGSVRHLPVGRATASTRVCSFIQHTSHKMNQVCFALPFCVAIEIPWTTCS